MNDILNTVLVFVGGIVLGILFFGGLWFTVKKMVNSKRAALWLFTSFFLRIGIALLGFYFIGFGNWQRILICLVGFIAGRFIVIHYTKARPAKSFQIEKEVFHET